MTQDLKNTPLYDCHLAAGAKMVSFAGFNMPLHYSGIQLEHKAVRMEAGLFDVSHMGEFLVSGPGAMDTLQRTTINDVSHLQPGQAQYSAMCNEKGGLIDDMVIYRRSEDYMLVVNADNTGKDYHWLESHLAPETELRDRSNDMGLIALQGPRSRQILQPISPMDLKGLAFYRFVETTIDNARVLLSRTGYTGELGYEIYAANEDLPGLWDTLMDSGAPLGLIPAGLGARDTLRLEMKYCLYGLDITEETTPLEAGLGWITKLEKQDSFIGQNALIHQKNDFSRKLVCIEMLDKAIPRRGYRVFIQDREIGSVTSGTHSPSLNKGIALAYVDRKVSKSGTEVLLEIRGKGKRGTIVKPPFYKSGSVYQ